MSTSEAGTDSYDYYEAMVRGSRAERLFHAARVRLLLEPLDWQGRQVLELGSGAGAVAVPLAEAGAAVTAVELLPDHLDAIARHAASRGVQVEALQGDASSLPFEDSSFDVVVLASLVHLVADPRGILREAERVCRPTGRLVVAGPWRWHPKSMTTVKRLLGRKPSGPRHPFSVSSLRRDLAGSRLLEERKDRAMGYVVTLWSPDRKPA